MRFITVIKCLLATLLLTAIGNISIAQSHPLLGRFFVVENNGEVFLSWTIVAGSTCNGIQILRSTDSINFTRIGGIPGICGSISQEETYDFTDTSPVKNKINYYRLELGNYGLSQIIAIEVIDFANNHYQIRPNPVYDEGNIYFKKTGVEEHILTLYSMNGASIFSTRSSEEYFKINAAAFLPGLYFFKISAPGNLLVAKGKLLVQH